MTSDKTNPQENKPESAEEVQPADTPDTNSADSQELAPPLEGEEIILPEEPSGDAADAAQADSGELAPEPAEAGEGEESVPKTDENEEAEETEKVGSESPESDSEETDSSDSSDDEDEEEEEGEKNMGILEHLDELRSRLIYSALFLVLGFCLALFVSKPVVHFLYRPFSNIEIKRTENNIAIRINQDGTLKVISPHDPKTFKNFSSYRFHWYLADTKYDSAKPDDTPPDSEFGQNNKKPIFLNPMDPLMIWFKATMILAVIIALPLILSQVWLFVSPGLKEREKKVIIPIMVMGCVLFPLGATFAYLAFSKILDFLLNFQIVSMEPMLNAAEFLQLELRLMMGFGIAFELPIVVMFLTMLGLLTPKRMREWRPYAIVAIAVISMFCTPPDPVSMLTLMVPLVLLYEISIIVSIPIARKKEEEEDKLNAELEADDVAATAVESSSEDDSEGGSGYSSDSSYDGSSSDDEYNYNDEYNTDYNNDTYSNTYYSEEYERTKMNRKRWKRKQLVRHRRAATTKVSAARKARKR